MDVAPWAHRGNGRIALIVDQRGPYIGYRYTHPAGFSRRYSVNLLRTVWLHEDRFHAMFAPHADALDREYTS